MAQDRSCMNFNYCGADACLVKDKNQRADEGISASSAHSYRDVYPVQDGIGIESCSQRSEFQYQNNNQGLSNKISNISGISNTAHSGSVIQNWNVGNDNISINQYNGKNINYNETYLDADGNISNKYNHRPTLEEELSQKVLANNARYQQTYQYDGNSGNNTQYSGDKYNSCETNNVSSSQLLSVQRGKSIPNEYNRKTSYLWQVFDRIRESFSLNCWRCMGERKEGYANITPGNNQRMDSMTPRSGGNYPNSMQSAKNLDLSGINPELLGPDTINKSPRKGGNLVPISFKLHAVEVHQFVPLPEQDEPEFFNMMNNPPSDRSQNNQRDATIANPEMTGMPAPILSHILSRNRPR